MISSSQKQLILEVLKPLNPKMIGVFGSRARNEFADNSDLDILIEPGEKINLLDLIGAEQKLSDILKIKVDLVSRNGLSPYIAPYIEKDLQEIYNAEG